MRLIELKIGLAIDQCWEHFCRPVHILLARYLVPLYFSGDMTMEITRVKFIAARAQITEIYYDTHVKIPRMHEVSSIKY